MNMEMMDYERAVNELKNQVEIKTNEANAALQGKSMKIKHFSFLLEIEIFDFQFDESVVLCTRL